MDNDVVRAHLHSLCASSHCLDHVDEGDTTTEHGIRTVTGRWEIPGGSSTPLYFCRVRSTRLMTGLLAVPKHPTGCRTVDTSGSMEGYFDAGRFGAVCVENIVSDKTIALEGSNDGRTWTKVDARRAKWFRFLRVSTKWSQITGPSGLVLGKQVEICGAFCVVSLTADFPWIAGGTEKAGFSMVPKIHHEDGLGLGVLASVEGIRFLQSDLPEELSPEEAQGLLSLQAQERVSSDKPFSWLGVDFGPKRRFSVQRYSLRHGLKEPEHYVRQWALQGSNDNVEWENLRFHTADSSLNFHPFASASWPVSLQNSCPFRMLRVMQMGENSSGHDVLALSGMELFGVLLTEMTMPQPETAPELFSFPSALCLDDEEPDAVATPVEGEVSTTQEESRQLALPHVVNNDGDQTAGVEMAFPRDNEVPIPASPRLEYSQEDSNSDDTEATKTARQIAEIVTPSAIELKPPEKDGRTQKQIVGEVVSTVLGELISTITGQPPAPQQPKTNGTAGSPSPMPMPTSTLRPESRGTEDYTALSVDELHLVLQEKNDHREGLAKLLEAQKGTLIFRLREQLTNLEAELGALKRKKAPGGLASRFKNLARQVMDENALSGVTKPEDMSFSRVVRLAGQKQQQQKRMVRLKFRGSILRAAAGRPSVGGIAKAALAAARAKKREEEAAAAAQASRVPASSSRYKPKEGEDDSSSDSSVEDFENDGLQEGEFHLDFSNMEVVPEKKDPRLVRKFLSLCTLCFLIFQLVVACGSAYAYWTPVSWEGEPEEDGEKPSHDLNGQEFAARCFYLHGFYVYSMWTLMAASVLCCEVAIISKFGQLDIFSILPIDTKKFTERKWVKRALSLGYCFMTMFAVSNMFTIITYEAYYLLTRDDICWPFIEGTPYIRRGILLQLGCGFFRAWTSKTPLTIQPHAFTVICVALRHIYLEWKFVSDVDKK